MTHGGSNSISICAACGKSGDNLKACTACHLVKYCNRDCQILHRPKHKKECRKRAAELGGDDTTSADRIVNDISESISKVSISGSVPGSTTTADKKMNTSYEQNNNYDDIGKVAISDDELFKDHPPKEDCPICMQPMPHASGACGIPKTYQQCCGKTLCYGCVLAAQDEIKKGNMKEWCPFCRVPIVARDKARLQQLKKRLELYPSDAAAFHRLGLAYYTGVPGLKKDQKKSFELFAKSAQLGLPEGLYFVAAAYASGTGVGQDRAKAIQYTELAAIGGHEVARHLLGVTEIDNGNTKQAMKHFIIAARAGEDRSLKVVGKGYKAGHVTKDEYANTLRYQVSENEMKSEQRAKALIVCRQLMS